MAYQYATVLSDTLCFTKISQCLNKISRMSDADVMNEYGFVEELSARNLKIRATGEYTLNPKNLKIIR